MYFLMFNILLFISKYNTLIPPLNALDGGLGAVIVEGVDAVLIGAVVGNVCKLFNYEIKYIIYKYLRL